MTLLAPALLGVAAVIGASLPGSAQAPATLKIATTPTDIGSEVFYAQDKGFFKANGLDAQIQVISNGAAITSAVMSGALDIAQSNIVSLAAAHEAGLDVVVIAPAGQYSSKVPTTALIVAKNSPIKTAKDLNGKTIAGNGLKNITQVGAFAWMDKNGGDPSSDQVRRNAVPRHARGAGGRSRRCGGHRRARAERGAGQRRRSGARQLLRRHRQRLPDRRLVHDRQLGQSAPGSGETLRQSDRYETAGWANKNQSESGAMLTKYTKITVAPNMKRTIYADKLEPSLVQPLIDAAAKYGITKATFPAAQIIAPEAL